MDNRKDYRQIPPFKKYTNENHKKKSLVSESLNRRTITIECDFYEQALEQIPDDLKKWVPDFTWEALLKKIRTKNAILGRENPDNEDEVVLQHIRELLYNKYGDATFFDDFDPYLDARNSIVHTKGVTIEQLARKILEMIKVQQQEPSATLQSPSAQQDEDTVCPEVGEDLPFENRIYNFENYSHLLEEAVRKLKCKNYPDLEERMENAIVSEAGSLNLGDIIRAAAENADVRDTSRFLMKYLTDKAFGVIGEFSLDGNILVAGIDPEKKRRENEHFIRTALNRLVSDVVKSITNKIVSNGNKEMAKLSEEYSGNDDCIMNVLAKVLQDKTTTSDNLREKAANYARNYFASENTGKPSESVIEEIADEVAGKLKHKDFDNRPNASVAAKIKRDSIKNEPENRYVRLR